MRRDSESRGGFGGNGAARLLALAAGHSRQFQIASWSLFAVLVVIDLVLGSDFRLSTLFVLPPLIAALGSSARQTLGLGIVCTLAAIAIAFTNDSFGDANFYARIAGIAIANGLAWAVASLREALLDERSRMMLLADSGVLVEETLEWDATLAKIAGLAVPALCDGASIDIYDRTRESIRSALVVGATPELERRMHSIRDGFEIDPSSEHPVARALRSTETLLVPHVDDAVLASFGEIGPGYGEAIRKAGVRAGLIVPLRAHGRMLGVMTLLSFRGGYFAPEQVAVAEELGRRVAFALDNARRHRGQAHIADVLQRSLQPEEIPDVPGLEIAARFLPAGEQNEVGGDFYDVIALPDGSVAAVIGDVSGKGAEAAAVTAIARNTLRAERLESLSPSQALARLNEVLCERLGDGRFCTAAYARVAPGNGGARVSLSLGGHPRPLVMRADGRIEELGRQGTLLGGFSSPQLSDSEAAIETGETLVLYTDGALETRGSEQAGPRGSMSHVADDLAHADPSLTPAAIAEHIERRALARQHGNQRDDIALLVLRP